MGFEELVVEFLVFDAIGYMFGGFPVFLIGVYGHLSDTTSTSSRTLRMALFDVTYFIAHAVGFFLNSFVYKRFGYYGNFGVSFILLISAVFLVLILFKKNKKVQEDDTSGPGPFSLKNITESFKVLTKPRASSMRHIVSLLIFCFQMWSISYWGLGFIEFLYIRKRMVWSDLHTLVSWYNNFRSYDGIMNILAMLVVCPFLVKILKLSNITIINIAAVAWIIKCLFFYFTHDKDVLLFVLGCSLFMPFLTTSLRSTMSIVVGAGDAGKVFACVGSLQAITGLAAPLYNLLYIATMDSNLGAVYLLSGGLYTLVLIIVIYIQIFLKRIERRKARQENNQDILGATL